MRSLSIFSIALLFSVGCTEYTFDEGSTVLGQPNPPDLSTPVNTDRIVQTTVPAVDVLWVIDNSCSMSDKQESLAANFPGFMQFFLDSGLDYHVGVVSTDMTDFDHSGKLQEDDWTGVKYIDDQTSQPVEVFQRMATLGTSGDAYEQGREAAYVALETRAQTDNYGFARDDAFLSVVVISDEDDYSEDDVIGLQPFISWFQNLRATPDMVSFSSIVGPDFYCPESWEEGVEYLEITRTVGGIEWSICDPNWDQVLQALGMQAAGLRREFFLSEIPVEESIDVWVVDIDGQTIEFQIGLEYDYDRSRNSVRFNSYVPNPLAEVFIEYEVLAGVQDQTGQATDTGS